MCFICEKAKWHTSQCHEYSFIPTSIESIITPQREANGFLMKQYLSPRHFEAQLLKCSVSFYYTLGLMLHSL